MHIYTEVCIYIYIHIYVYRVRWCYMGLQGCMGAYWDFFDIQCFEDIYIYAYTHIKGHVKIYGV